MTPRFLQIHTLHSYPAALLNRDDSGLAKRMPFGGAVRTRVSSQCLKRHWRVSDDRYSIRNIANGTSAVRSRNAIDRAVMPPLTTSGRYTEEVLDAVTTAFNKGVYGDKGEKEGARQPLLLGMPEVEYLREHATRICDLHPDNADDAEKAAQEVFKKNGKNFKAFREQVALPSGLEGAMFGRMVTSDPGANIEAAVHVAHAFTVHAEESESDYFSVVDDLQKADAGAAYIGDTELTSGLFYGYVVVDVPGLISNLEGCPTSEWLDTDTDRTMAAEVIRHLIHLIATVSPGAKRGSTAPYSYADMVLIEMGDRQPRSLSNAFRSPIAAQTGTATRALGDYLARLDTAYGTGESRRVTSVEDCELPNTAHANLEALASWTADAVLDGRAP